MTAFLFRLFIAFCIAMVFFAGGQFALGHYVQGLAAVAVGAGWLGIIYSVLLRWRGL
jgi:hypothetical protein